MTNKLVDRVYQLIEMIGDQMDSSERAVINGISEKELKEIKNIYLTGCGDSFMAAKVAINILDKYANNTEHDYRAVSPIEFSRYEKFSDEINPAESLLIGISASGSPARVKEAMLRAKHLGMKTLAVTNNPSSKVGKVADYVLVSNNPEVLNDSPGFLSYVGSMATLTLFSLKYGEAHGLNSDSDTIKDSIVEYVKSYSDNMETYVKDLEGLAKKYLDSKVYTFIGDNDEASSASFSAAKIVEVAGKITVVNNSEEWCHINYFNQFTQDNPVFILANSKSSNLSRVSETLNQANDVGHPTVLISDVDSLDYITVPKDTHVISLPNTDNPYLQSFGSFIPGTIFSAFLAEKLKEPYFRGDSFPIEAMTPSNSEIYYIK